MKWFVYILLCEGGSFYTGITLDVERRFQEHASGSGGRYTRSHPVKKILLRENFLTKNEALKREIEIKKWSRKKKIEFIRLKTTQRIS